MQPHLPSQVPSATGPAAAPAGASRPSGPPSPGRPDGPPDGPAAPSGSPASLVREFHRAFGLDVRTVPGEVAPALAEHRGALLAEEAAEVAEVSVAGPLDRLAHELADVVYVAYGTALVHGIDLDAVISEIHRANMTKIGPDGRIARRADGKVLKGDHYRAPDVADVLRRQGWEEPGTR
ncbi:MazG nucleotide pyrophosphohydrolase domain-containing protein [Streptomyces sp. NPDC048566]|uniref:MazG nucleotide pyrophosphohydrolase domain-containing protein n=1 Tax=Streptomyces sp. NPDC048566 TaxID=3365569 RepID=UPI00371A7BE5